MKKIFLSLVFLFGVGTFVMADDTMKVKNDTVAVEDGFKNIDLKEVPQSVKDAIAKKYPESTLKSASLSLKEEGVKAYRIIYVTKEGVENSILINIKTAVRLPSPLLSLSSRDRGKAPEPNILPNIRARTPLRPDRICPSRR